MSVKPQPIAALVGLWDDLTPVQQQFMIQRAQLLAARNRREKAQQQQQRKRSSTKETETRDKNG